MNENLNEQKPAWVVYLLRCSDGSFYTGVTNCLERRLQRHNQGTASKYTRSRRPVTLVATGARMTRSEALRLEAVIKKMPRNRKPEALRHLR